MSKYGISSVKIAQDNFLFELITEYCFGALFLYEDNNKLNQKNLLRLRNFEKKLPNELKDFKNSLSKRQKKDLANGLVWPLNKKIHSMPLRALIHPANGEILNKKIRNISLDIRLNDIQYKLSLNKEFKVKNEIFSNLHQNKIRKRIIWLNWFLNINISNPLRPRGNIIPNNALDKIATLKTNESIMNFLVNSSKKGKKHIVKKFFNNFDSDSFSKNELISFLSCLNKDTFNALSKFHKKGNIKKEMRLSLILCNQIHKDIFKETGENMNISNFPIYYLASFRPINNLLMKQYREIFFENNFRRLRQISIFSEKYDEAIFPLNESRAAVEAIRESFL